MYPSSHSTFIYYTVGKQQYSARLPLQMVILGFTSLKTTHIFYISLILLHVTYKIQESLYSNVESPAPWEARLHGREWSKGFPFYGEYQGNRHPKFAKQLSATKNLSKLKFQGIPPKPLSGMGISKNSMFRNWPCHQQVEMAEMVNDPEFFLCNIAMNAFAFQNHMLLYIIPQGRGGRISNSNSFSQVGMISL